MMRFLIIIVVLLLGIWALDAQFPDVLRDTEAKINLLHSSVLVALLAGGALFVREIKLTEAMKYGAIWLGALLLLVLGYSYRDVLLDSRLGRELVPGRASVQADGSIALKRGEGGHFHALMDVDGARVRFMVDTGATEIVLARDDARRAGFDVDALRYDIPTRTANGIGAAARIRIAHLRIGDVVLHDTPATVNKAEMSGSLLGMRFLNQFRRYHVDGDTLTLIP